MTNIFAKSSKISSLAEIEESVRGSIFSLGENSVIDSFVKVKFTGGIGDIIIGDYCYINSGCVFYSGNGIKLEDKVSIAANCVFAPVNHAYADHNLQIREQGFLPSKGGIIIEEDVWIGSGCVILDGSIIRKGTIVGAMSLVRGELKPYSLYAGNPIKYIRGR